jgi:Ca2+-binding EF-hand superfamily protein
MSAISSTASYWAEQYSASAARTPSQDLAGTLFQDLDSDRDQVLSPEESGLEQTVYNALDSDGSGTVSLAELEAALESSAMFNRMRMGLLEAQPQEDAKPLDAQQVLAGILSGEAGGQTASASGKTSASGGGGGGGAEEEEDYDQLDTNQDGVVSFSELEAAMKGGGSMKSMLMGLFSTLANNSYNASYAADSPAAALNVTA